MAERFSLTKSVKFHSICKENSLPQLSAANLKQLHSYDWPGNVRELQNIIERAAITSRDRLLQLILPNVDEPGTLQQATSVDLEPNESVVVPEAEMRRREQQSIITALKKSNWKIYGPDGAAQLLGIKPTTLSSRIKKMKIRKPTAEAQGRLRPKQTFL